MAIIVAIYAWYKVQRNTPGSFISLAANVLRPISSMQEWPEMNLPNLNNMHAALKTKWGDDRIYFQVSISGEKDDLADLLNKDPSVKLRFALDDSDGFEIYQQSIALNQSVRTVSLASSAIDELVGKYSKPGTYNESLDHKTQVEAARRAAGLLPESANKTTIYSYESKGDSPMQSDTYKKLSSWNIRFVE